MIKPLFYIIISGILVLTRTAHAQPLLNGQAIAENVRIVLQGQEVKVSFDIDLTNLKIKGNRLYLLSPYLKTSKDSKKLPSIEISGRRRYIYNMRNGQQTASNTTQESLRRKNHTEQTVSYLTTVPWQEWMNNAVLEISEGTCGCHNTLLSGRNEIICQLDLIPHPHFAWETPAVEMPKIRQETRSARLDFPVNKTGIYPDYLNNPEELKKITSAIDHIKNDQDITITGITIKGFASPEGSYALNTRLAKDRSENFKEYLRKLYHFQDSICSVEYEPEDWQGLQKMVEASDMEYRDQILEIIQKETDPEARNFQLMALHIGRPYHYMLKNFFPALRHIDYSIQYNVRGFQIEEAQKILKQQPEKLSLHELYAIAKTYEPGTQEYNEVFKIALQMFPETPAANLNAANVAIDKGDYQAAHSYLAKAGDSPLAIHARGVLAMMEKDYPTAKDFLLKAKARNVTEAVYNLTELEKINPEP